MKILVLNAGSGSQRCSLFELEQLPPPGEPRDPLWEATVDATAPGQPPGKLRVNIRGADGVEREAAQIDAQLSPADRIRQLLELLWTGEAAPVRGPDAIDAIAHRVVHGGKHFDRAIRIDARVETLIDQLSRFAPLHNPTHLAGIRVARERCGEKMAQYAVFDTAFHRTLPPRAATYPGPYEWLDQDIRRYGFHGTNFRWVATRAARLLGRLDDPDLRLILCHIGGGCSLCATRGGVSIDTTMGFTPLDGIAMCTRSGSLDPGILIYLQRQGLTSDQIEKTLNKQSGLKGLSGISGDTRELTPAAASGSPRAALALDVFIYRLQSGIGQMLAALGAKPHAIVFTDAIAEDEPWLRERACASFGFLGLSIDPTKNQTASPDCDLSSSASDVRTLLIKSRENWQIARECLELQP